MSQEILPTSSPVATASTSRYTWRHLSVLSSASPAKESPLRVISLCDLDCFYAQVEALRVGHDPKLPLAVSQWGGLIAINYAARAAGITRHENAVSARQKCPDIRLVHVQTWREGDTESRYHENPEIPTHKVSLDPYRRESRKILEVFKRHCDRVEKASIDESYLDLSTIIKQKLMERYGDDLLKMPEGASLDAPLPEPPLVDWTSQTGVMVPLDGDHAEDDRPDWDEVCMLIGAQHMDIVRADVHNTLGYTTSAGIARNKTLAKLAAGQNKPARQTILRNRAVQSFLNRTPLSKIRMLGGKLGSEVERLFATSSVEEMTAVSISELRTKLGLETGQWLWNILRGIDYAEVNTNTQVKSMLSAKSFRPQIDSPAQAERWIRVLTADLASRLLEDPQQRRPRTLTMHHRVPGASKSRQCPIPKGPDLTAPILGALASKLFHQINTEGRAFPCFNLSLGLGGFEGMEDGVQDIGGFFRRPSECESKKRPASTPPERESPPPVTTFACERCSGKRIDGSPEEHADWHFAKDLARDFARSDPPAPPPPPTQSQTPRNHGLKPKKRELEKGQRRLQF
ncbi:N-acetyltransferase eso1 [Savitreella phatthalungensis]